LFVRGGLGLIEETNVLSNRVRDRMMSGEAFVYDDLLTVCPDESWQRINSAIQAARRRGDIRKIGRQGQKTIWQAVTYERGGSP
jgi:hypothetical protein